MATAPMYCVSFIWSRDSLVKDVVNWIILVSRNVFFFSGEAVLKSKKKLVSNEWVRITATKSGQEGSLIINNEEPVKGRLGTGNQQLLYTCMKQNCSTLRK